MRIKRLFVLLYYIVYKSTKQKLKSGIIPFNMSIKLIFKTDPGVKYAQRLHTLINKGTLPYKEEYLDDIWKDIKYYKLIIEKNDVGEEYCLKAKEILVELNSLRDAYMNMCKIQFNSTHHYVWKL